MKFKCLIAIALASSATLSYAQKDYTLGDLFDPTVHVSCESKHGTLKLYVGNEHDDHTKQNATIVFFPKNNMEMYAGIVQEWIVTGHVVVANVAIMEADLKHVTYYPAYRDAESTGKMTLKLNFNHKYQFANKGDFEMTTEIKTPSVHSQYGIGNVVMHCKKIKS